MLCSVGQTPAPAGLAPRWYSPHYRSALSAVLGDFAAAAAGVEEDDVDANNAGDEAEDVDEEDSAQRTCR